MLYQPQYFRHSAATEALSSVTTFDKLIARLHVPAGINGRSVVAVASDVRFYAAEFKLLVVS